MTLVQAFNVNTKNELTTATRSGSLTVAGNTTTPATSVTVNGLAATRYADKTFAKEGFSLSDGTNSFTAIAEDGWGRKDTNAVSVFLPATVTFTYDANGNLTSDGRRGFDYDDENQLIRVTVANSWKSEFTYDGRMRRRIRKEFTWSGSAWTLASETRYVYDGTLVLQERNASNQPLVTYTRGLDLSGSLQGAGGIGGLLARTDHATGQSAYYHADGGGNITALVNGAPAIVARYTYDPYGNLLAKAGALADANLYRFSSKETHTSSGLIYYGQRFYEPNLQRWVNQDPLGEAGGINLYGFVFNSPLMLIDPYGLDPWFDELAAWAQREHAQFSMGMTASAGDGNSWMVAGALNTVSELAAGFLSYPQALSQLGAGSGTFSARPTLENSAGVFSDVSLAASAIAMGVAPLPSANRPLLKRPCPPRVGNPTPTAQSETFSRLAQPGGLRPER